METTAKITKLAYANLDCAPDDPDAFDISSVILNAVEISVYPRIICYTVTRRETECDSANYNIVFDDIDSACKKFKEIIERNNVTKVGLCNDIYDYLEEDEPYTRCSTYGDYGPSNPWDAPGMKVSDFI